MTVSLLPTRTDTPWPTIGLDLTGLGVATTDERLGADLPVAKADLARLASYTRAAHQEGVDFVAIGEAFRLRSDRAVRSDAWLDPATAARRISPHAGPGGLVPAVAARDVALLAGELAEISRAGTAWTGLQLTGDASAVARGLDRLARSTRGPLPRVVVDVRDENDVEVAGSFADVVRIRERDPGWARELRYAVRAATRAAGRPDVTVLADLHVVVSGNRAAAQERAALVADIAGDGAAWAGALSAVGTVGDVVDAIESWVSAGAADGFTVLPGSLPADVAALVRGVLPELRRRGLAGPAPAQTAEPARRSRPAAASARRVSRGALAATPVA